MKYLKYLEYLMKHKWYVMRECFKFGLYWQGITHDLSKFLPNEFFPYVNHFFGKQKRHVKKKQDATGYFKPAGTGEREFDLARLRHQKRNPHHWQWWILRGGARRNKNIADAGKIR